MMIGDVCGGVIHMFDMWPHTVCKVLDLHTASQFFLSSASVSLVVYHWYTHTRGGLPRFSQPLVGSVLEMKTSVLV